MKCVVGFDGQVYLYISNLLVSKMRCGVRPTLKLKSWHSSHRSGRIIVRQALCIFCLDVPLAICYQNNLEITLSRSVFNRGCMKPMIEGLE